MASETAFSWRGTGVALVTPFTADGSLDLPALKRVVAHVIAGGVDYLVPLGTTGETATLDEDEAIAVVDTVLAANNGRLPVLLGCGGNNTKAVAHKMEAWGKRFQVQGYLSVSPYYNRPTQEGIYQHYKVLAGASPLPIVLYNVPPRTGSNMLPETVLRLAHDFANIVAIKEASGSIEQGGQILRSKPAGFAVISGDDGLAWPGIAVGMAGLISVAANSHPALVSGMVQAALAGEPKTAQEAHLRLLPLIELLFREGNPAGVKAALAHLGVAGPDVRLPLVSATRQLRSFIHDHLQKTHGERTSHNKFGT